MPNDLTLELFKIAGPLLGVFIGGLIAFFSSRGIENSRWKHERQEKLLVLRRNAITAALEWIEPMRNAEIQASSLVMAATQGIFEHEQFMQEFPYLLGDLKNKELSAGQRAVIPDSIYKCGQQIVRSIDELRYLGVKYGQEALIKKRPMGGGKELYDKLECIKNKISKLETTLRNEFHKTFE